MGIQMKSYKSNECIVAFIDVLGSSEEMKNNPSQSLNAIHNAYDDALDMYNNLHSDEVPVPQIKIFSDNIIIYSPCEPDTKSAFYSVVILCGLIQNLLLHNRLLIRGGVTKGDFFADDVMVWGNALVRAHKLESEIAIYPRVIIDPQLIYEISFFQDNGPMKSTFGKWLDADHDGLIYIDYLNQYLDVDNGDFVLQSFQEENEKRTRRHNENLKIFQKLNWHDIYLRRKLFEFEKNKENNS